jgi:tetratricopeptide (TPR) repeat protein
MFKLSAHVCQLWWNDVLGSWALFLNQPQRAIARYQASLILDPTSVHAQHCLANIYARQQQYALALQLLESLSAQAPHNPVFIFNQGYLHNELDQLTQAEQAFLQTLKLDPKHDRAWYGLGILYMKQNRLQEALSALENNTQLQPLSPYGWYQLAMVQQRLGQGIDAQKTLHHLRSFEPKFARGLAVDLARFDASACTSPPSL